MPPTAAACVVAAATVKASLLFCRRPLLQLQGVPCALPSCDGALLLCQGAPRCAAIGRRLYDAARLGLWARGHPLRLEQCYSSVVMQTRFSYLRGAGTGFTGRLAPPLTVACWLPPLLSTLA